MIEKEKSACVKSIHTGIVKTKDWRDRLAAQYPNDTRNKRAAEKLAKLADQTSNLTNHDWEILKPFFSDLVRWRDCISQTTRQIGFVHNATSFQFFIRTLIGFLKTEKGLVA